jgi:hypothetical protein
LFGGDAPPQINVDYFDITVTRTPTKLGKDLPDEQIALLGKIPECGGKKDADAAGVKGHRLMFILILSSPVKTPVTANQNAREICVPFFANDECVEDRKNDFFV